MSITIVPSVKEFVTKNFHLPIHEIIKKVVCTKSLNILLC